MDTLRWSRWLYLANATLLFTHEIDAAYWQEWQMFRLPGGIQLFVALHVVLLAFFLYGHGQVTLGTRRGAVFSLLLAAAGLLGVALHGAFLLAGDPAFRLPVSLLVLAAVLPVSVTQAIVAVRMLRA